MTSEKLTSQQLYRSLSEKLDGLFYPSETDSPIDIFLWETDSQGALTLNSLLGCYGFSDDVTVAEVPVEEFFEGLTDIYEWHTEDELDATRRYAEAQKLFFANVISPKHYWIGENTIHVFLIGRTCDGNYIGLRTYIVET